MNEGRDKAADGAPLDRDGHHAVHHEHDEEIVPDHDVSVQLQAALLGSEAVEDAACKEKAKALAKAHQSLNE